jgi:hypothetical protein
MTSSKILMFTLTASTMGQSLSFLKGTWKLTSPSGVNLGTAVVSEAMAGSQASQGIPLVTTITGGPLNGTYSIDMNSYGNIQLTGASAASKMVLINCGDLFSAPKLVGVQGGYVVHWSKNTPVPPVPVVAPKRVNGPALRE